MDCIGSVILRASVNGVTVTLNALVSRSLSDEILISWHDLINMRVIPANFPHAQCSQVSTSDSVEDSLEKVISDFPTVLSDTLSATPMKRPPMHIHLREDVPIVPMRVMTTSRVPIHQTEAAQPLVDRLVKDGVLMQQNYNMCN